MLEFPKQTVGFGQPASLVDATPFGLSHVRVIDDRCNVEGENLRALTPLGGALLLVVFRRVPRPRIKHFKAGGVAKLEVQSAADLEPSVIRPIARPHARVRYHAERLLD